MIKQRPIVLMGLPGSGKSTIGKALAAQMHMPFQDLDAVIESEAGCSIPLIFSEKGEDYFRQMETRMLQKILPAAAPLVIALGGGTPCYFDNLPYIKQHAQSLYLQTPWEVLAQRLASQHGQRPLIAEAASHDRLVDVLQQKFEWRLPFYEQADIIIHLDTDKPLANQLQKIVSLINEKAA